MNNLLLL